MQYDSFKESLLNLIMSGAEEGTGARISKRRKNNGVMTECLSVIRMGSSVGPSVSLEECYREYMLGTISMQELASGILGCCAEKKCGDEIRRQMASPGDNIRMRVINYEMNRDVLERMPHRRLLDLACVCYVRTDLPDDGWGICDVTEDMLAMWGMEEEELFRTAEKNTRLMDPPECRSVGDALLELGGESSAVTEADAAPFYVISGRSRMYGAVCAVYQDYLRGVSGALGADLFILPSSIHEILAVPDCGEFSAETLEIMVREVNRTHVAPQEILSNRVYRFERERGYIMI